MKSSRRTFLKIAGLSVAGLSVKPVVNAVAAGKPTFSPDPNAFKGKRWVMVVDHRKLTEEGIQAAIESCHSFHNVPDIGNIKEEIKWIWEAGFHNAFPDQAHAAVGREVEEKPFLVMCNHCENPPCVRVCPTKATFKREGDGIVMMDMHRCIGCRFCMAACPYGSRSFNFQDPRPFIKKENPTYPTRERGVVEKCTFCAERLAVGQIPACVEASRKAGCEALTFGDLNDPESEVSRLLRKHYAIRRKSGLGTGPGVYYII